MLLDFFGIISLVKAKDSLFLPQPPSLLFFLWCWRPNSNTFLWCKGFTPPARQWLIFAAIFQEVIQNSVATTLQGLPIGKVKAFYSFQQL